MVGKKQTGEHMAVQKMPVRVLKYREAGRKAGFLGWILGSIVPRRNFPDLHFQHFPTRGIVQNCHL